MSESPIVVDPPAQRWRDPGGQAESPTLPLPPPRDRDELERFILAVATTPAGDRQLIIDTIRDLDQREAVAELLHEALFTLPVTDVGRHATLLSVIGELADPSSTEVLERFVWLRDEEVYAPDSHEGEAGHSANCMFPDGAGLQARSAEMLVWVTQRNGLSGPVTKILREHPDELVRLSAIDAAAYVADDRPDQLDRLRELVSTEDQWMVGLPRRAANRDGMLDVDAFDAEVEQQQRRIGSAPALPARASHGPTRSMEGGDDVR